MWTKAKDCALKTTRGASDMLVSTTRASLTVDDAAAMRDQLNELREENAALKEALDEVRIQTNGQSS